MDLINANRQTAPNTVRSSPAELPLHDIDAPIIKNVGNLFCPAEFTVGEDVRVVAHEFLRNPDAVNPGVECITSAATGEGVDGWCSWPQRRKG